MNEKELIELECKAQQQQFQIIQFVFQQYPEVKQELKPVLLDLCGLTEKTVRQIMGWNETEDVAIELSDDEEPPTEIISKKTKNKKSKN